jgi:hypothetical protein
MSEHLKSPLAEKERRKKVYSSVDQIEAIINRNKKKLVKQQEIVEQQKDKIKELGITIMKLEEQKPEDWEDQVFTKKLAIGKCKETISKAERCWRRIEDKTLPKLKNALSEMRTETMPVVMGSYVGVAV